MKKLLLGALLPSTDVFSEPKMNKIKKETLEEVAENFWLNDDAMTDNDRISYVNGFVTCAKWQMERSYSEEDMKSAFKVGFSIGYGSDVHAIYEKNRTCDEWFEKYKKEIICTTRAKTIKKC